MPDLRYDAEAADADLKAYAANMARGNYRACLAIEGAWGLAGLPPETVSCILAGVSEGASFDEAFDRWTTPRSGKPE